MPRPSPPGGLGARRVASRGTHLAVGDAENLLKEAHGARLRLKALATEGGGFSGVRVRGFFRVSAMLRRQRGRSARCSAEQGRARTWRAQRAAARENGERGEEMTPAPPGQGEPAFFSRAERRPHSEEVASETKP